MVFDYGTIGSMSIMGTMKKLSILRRENQGFFHGFASDRDRAGVMLKFQDLYYPQSHEFRLDAIDKTDKVIRDAATRFARSSALDSTPRS
jgi:hypothetical protein